MFVVQPSAIKGDPDCHIPRIRRPTGPQVTAIQCLPTDVLIFSYVLTDLSALALFIYPRREMTALLLRLIRSNLSCRYS